METADPFQEPTTHVDQWPIGMTPRKGKWIMQALLAAADWRRMAGGAAEADAAIDDACGRMGKGRELYEELLA